MSRGTAKVEKFRSRRTSPVPLRRTNHEKLEFDYVINFLLIVQAMSGAMLLLSLIFTCLTLFIKHESMWMFFISLIINGIIVISLYFIVRKFRSNKGNKS